MGCSKTGKTKQNSKITILDKSIMSEEVDSKGVEDLLKKVDNPDDAAELIKKIECIMKRKNNASLPSRYNF